MIADRISPAPFDAALYNIFNYSFQSGPLPTYKFVSDFGVSRNTFLQVRVRVKGGTPGKQPKRLEKQTVSDKPWVQRQFAKY